MEILQWHVGVERPYSVPAGCLVKRHLVRHIKKQFEKKKKEKLTGCATAIPKREEKVKRKPHWDIRPARRVASNLC
jgi:hypothetical protein